MLSSNVLVLLGATAVSAVCQRKNVQVGVRPYWLVDGLSDGPLKEKLMRCGEHKMKKSYFSIGHRGAPMMFPEHTRESYIAAARQGAGILECDVAYTSDLELVCRHAQCDLHTTTNILDTPLAAKCSEPFTPANDTTAASAKCCTTDITLAEFRTLKGKMDAANSQGRTVAEYMDGTASWRTDLYSSRGTLMTHKESIALFKELRVKMTPELKGSVKPAGVTQEMLARKLVDEYIAAGVPASDLFLQSFNAADVYLWRKEYPSMTAGTALLEDRVYTSDAAAAPNGFVPSDAQMQELVDNNVRFLSVPLFALVSTDSAGNMVESDYVKQVKKYPSVSLMAWTLERSGPLTSGGGWYYSSISSITTKDSDTLVLLDFLAQKVGIKGIFSDWPGTVTYYANCFKL